MTIKLLKPYTEIERCDFIVENNHNNALRIEETEIALFALKDCECLQDNEIVDISDTSAYKNKIRLQQIEIELTQADFDYQLVLDTPVEYTNGFLYKPSYVENYALLIASGVSPFVIWDSTELNSVSMAIEELIALAAFLKNIAEPAFQARKIARKALLEEKAQLENS